MSFSSKVSNIVKDFDGHVASPVENSASTVFDSFHLLDSSEVAELRRIKCSPLDFLFLICQVMALFDTSGY